MKSLRTFLSSALILISAAPVAHAGARFSPALTYEAFERKSPETAGVVRLGGAFRAIVDIPIERLALEGEVLYTNENTPFATENSLREVVYRGRVGANVRVFEILPIIFNARGGFQFNAINDTYQQKVSGIKEITHYRHGTAYGGFEVELLPVTGFGLQAGAVIAGDEVLNKWIPMFYLGVVIR